MVDKKSRNKNDEQARRRQAARDERKRRGRRVEHPPDDGIGAFPPISDETPGQEESHAAFESFNARRDFIPWWMEYLDIRAEGWDWRKAALIAWMMLPPRKRWPKTQEELAELLGLNSARSLRKWREDDPEIERRVTVVRKQVVFDVVDEVLVAAIAVAKRKTPYAHPDRKMILQMGGMLAEKGAGGTEETGGPEELGDVTDEERRAIEQALVNEAEGVGETQ